MLPKVIHVAGAENTPIQFVQADLTARQSQGHHFLPPNLPA